MAQTSAQKMQALRARRRLQGLKTIEIWCKAENERKIRNFAESLQLKTESKEGAKDED